MITQYGMNDEIGFVNIESRVNPYLGNDTVMNASNETARLVDEQVRILVEKAHEKAINILKENMEKLHEISRHLLVRESITGEEFMAILEGKTEVEDETNEENNSIDQVQSVEETHLEENKEDSEN